MAKRSTAGLIKYVKFLTEAGVMKPPLWLDAVERVPPLPTPKSGHRPPTIRFPEDDIVKAYYARNPAASLEPVDLGSFEPNTARRFAARQLQLMEQGLSRKEAKAQTEKEFSATQRESNGASNSIVHQIQLEEESHLKEAVAMYTERHGYKPMGGQGSTRHTRNTQRRTVNTPPITSSATGSVE